MEEYTAYILEWSDKYMFEKLTKTENARYAILFHVILSFVCFIFFLLMQNVDVC